VLGSRVHEIEVMSACVNPSKENSTPAALLPVTPGKVMLPITVSGSDSVSMIVSTMAARETEGATTKATIIITVITLFFVRIAIHPRRKALRERLAFKYSAEFQRLTIQQLC
jgi:hypothetical protein